MNNIFSAFALPVYMHRKMFRSKAFDQFDALQCGVTGEIPCEKRRHKSTQQIIFALSSWRIINPSDRVVQGAFNKSTIFGLVAALRQDCIQRTHRSAPGQEFWILQRYATSAIAETREISAKYAM
jgi:hypothetical protein